MGADLEKSNSTRQIPQPMLTQIGQRDTIHQRHRRHCHQDLTAVTRGHHPSGAIQHRPEIVAITFLSLTGGDTHTHRQLEQPFRFDRRVDRSTSRPERGAHPVPGVLEQPTAMSLDRRTQHPVMHRQSRAHRLGFGFPTTGRTLDIGEQERHSPRRANHDWTLRQHPQPAAYRSRPERYDTTHSRTHPNVRVGGARGIGAREPAPRQPTAHSTPGHFWCPVGAIYPIVPLTCGFRRQHRRVVRFFYRLLLALVVLAARSGRSKDIEIVVLRHQIAVLQPTAKPPRLNEGDRSLLAAIAGVLPRSRLARGG